MDPLSSMAETDAHRLGQLLNDIGDSNAMSSLLSELKMQAEQITLELAKQNGPSQNRLGVSKEKKSRQVKVILYTDEVDLFERAMRETGNMNRGQALLDISRAYLEAKGQLDIPQEGIASAQEP